MQNADQIYMDIIDNTLLGHHDSSRTGINTTSSPFQMSKYPLVGGAVPLLTTKKIFLKSLLVELEWYISGKSNTRFLTDNGVKIWDLWADERGELGPVYGVQWRNCPDTRVIPRSKISDYVEQGYDIVMEDDHRAVAHRKIDQLQNMVDALRTNPDSRRILLSAWNVAQLDDMRLPPCHMVWQLCSKKLTMKDRFILALTLGRKHIEEKVVSRYAALSLTMDSLTAAVMSSESKLDELLTHFQIPERGLYGGVYQRSVDVGIGLPFNIAGYSVLTHFMAHITDHLPMSLTHFGGDVHVYDDHIEPLKLQRDRAPIDCHPIVVFPAHWRELSDFNWREVVIADYGSHSPIPMPVAK